MNLTFKALNDPTRREILRLLRKNEMTAGEIAAHFDIGKPSISHHLDILRQGGLVTSSKNGQFVVYTLNTTVLDDVMTWFINLKNDE